MFLVYGGKCHYPKKIWFKIYDPFFIWPITGRIPKKVGISLEIKFEYNKLQLIIVAICY